MTTSVMLITVVILLSSLIVSARDGAFLVVYRRIVDPDKPVKEWTRGHLLHRTHPGVVQAKEFTVAYDFINIGKGYDVEKRD